MTPIKMRPRQQKYRCDFCKYTATHARMERHEALCWSNPKRFCENCKNTGEEWTGVGDGVNEPAYMQPCFFCSQFDAEKLPPEIAARYQVRKPGVVTRL